MLIRKKTNKNREDRRSRIFSVPLLLLFVTLSYGTEKDGSPVIITGDNVKTKLLRIENGKKIYLTELTGKPKIKYGDKTLLAKKIIIRGINGELAEAIGNVVLIDKKSKSKVNAQKAIYYKEKDIAEFTGNPRIETFREDDKSPVFIKADKMTYHINDDIGYAYGNVSLKNRDTKIFSEEAVYDREQNRASFTVKPYITRGDDTYRADKIFYQIDKKILLLNNNAHAITYSNMKDAETGEIKKIKTEIRGDKIENREEVEKVTIIYGSESEPAIIEREDSLFTGNKIEIKGEEGENIFADDVYINYIKENVETRGKKFKSSKEMGYSALWGDSLLIIKDENTKEESSIIYGDYMEFFEDIDSLHIFGNIKINSNAGVIKGDMARYVRADNNMHVTGNAMIEKKDTTLYSQEIIFNTKTNKTTMIGDIKGQGIK